MEFFFRDDVQRALERVDPAAEPLAAATALRRLLPNAEARAAAQLLALRRRAQGKLLRPETLFLTEKGLEQASHHRVAEARSRVFGRRAAGALVLDATAGIGGDSMHLADAGAVLVAADADPGLAALLGANLRAGGHGGRAVCARAERPPVAPDFLLLDPDRRPGDGTARGRTGHPEQWSPPWSTCLALAAGVRGACLKLAPATDPERLDPPPPRALGPAWQWVSLRGELKELALWTGELVEGIPAGMRGVLALDGHGGRATLVGRPREVAPLSAEDAAGVRWIAEPDPALIRSGLLGLAAAAEDLAPLGPGLAYLGGGSAPKSPLLAGFEVLDHAPADRRRVRTMLATHGIGPVTVKRRGHPDDAATLARRLRGSGKERGLLVVARLARGHRAYLVRRDA